MQAIKQQLYNLCLQHIQENIRSIERAIAESREASQNETKSSMGDKYETAREMLQQDINMNLERLAKAKADENLLKHNISQQNTTKIELGSLVKTNHSWFYLAISAGKLSINKENYYAISLSSPIGTQLKGKKVGDSFILNSKTYQIEEIL